MAGRPGDDDLESKFAHWAADNRIFIHPSLQFVKCMFFPPRLA